MLVVQVLCGSYSLPVVLGLFPAAADLVSLFALPLVLIVLEEAPPTFRSTAVPAPARSFLLASTYTEK